VAATKHSTNNVTLETHLYSKCYWPCPKKKSSIRDHIWIGFQHPFPCPSNTRRHHCIDKDFLLLKSCKIILEKESPKRNKTEYKELNNRHSYPIYIEKEDRSSFTRIPASSFLAESSTLNLYQILIPVCIPNLLSMSQKNHAESEIRIRIGFIYPCPCPSPSNTRRHNCMPYQSLKQFFLLHRVKQKKKRT
jgi:hypothetical protein